MKFKIQYILCCCLVVHNIESSSISRWLPYQAQEVFLWPDRNTDEVNRFITGFMIKKSGWFTMEPFQQQKGQHDSLEELRDQMEVNRVFEKDVSAMKSYIDKVLALDARPLDLHPVVSSKDLTVDERANTICTMITLIHMIGPEEAKSIIQDIKSSHGVRQAVADRLGANFNVHMKKLKKISDG